LLVLASLDQFFLGIGVDTYRLSVTAHWEINAAGAKLVATLLHRFYSAIVTTKVWSLRSQFPAG